MTPEPPELEVSLEQDLPAGRGRPPRRVRVSARYRRGSPEPPDAELGALLARLQAVLDAAGGEASPSGGVGGGVVRPLGELIETYRPRQPELLELLRDDGEITQPEYELLRAHLERPGLGAAPSPPGIAVAPGEPPVTERPIAAAPLAQDRAPSTPRPVGDLLGLYRIESIKQAGAVRARRQISYEEYMALKRHFQAAETAAAADHGTSVASEGEAAHRGE